MRLGTAPTLPASARSEIGSLPSRATAAVSPGRRLLPETDGVADQCSLACGQGVSLLRLCPAAQTLSKKFASGVVGGMLGVLFATPFDVVKSRMQNQLADSAVVYRYTLPSLAHILRTEGFRALYKGIGPRIVRLGPGGGIMIVAFDVVSNLLRDL